MLSSISTDLHGSCCTVLAGLAARPVSASEGAQGPAPMMLTHAHDGTYHRELGVPALLQPWYCPIAIMVHSSHGRREETIHADDQEGPRS